MFKQRNMKKVAVLVLALSTMLSSLGVVQAAYYGDVPGEGSYEAVYNFEAPDALVYESYVGEGYLEYEHLDLGAYESKEPDLAAKYDELNEAHQLSLLAGSGLGINGVRVSKSISTASRADNYVDVTLSLDTNPGVWSFLTDIVFDEAVLTPVSVANAYDLQDFEIVLPPLEGGRYPGRLLFLGAGTNLSYETGLIATVRFRVGGGMLRELPIAIGYLEVVADDELGEMLESTASANHGVLSQHGLRFFEPFSTPPVIRNSRFINGIFLGDVNGSGSITTADGTFLARYLAGHYGVYIIRRNADLTVDGRLSLDDLVTLQRWLVGHNVPVGPQPNSITILPYEHNGLPSYNTFVEVWVNGELAFSEEISSGVITIPGVYCDDEVHFWVATGDGVFTERTIHRFFYELDGIQALRAIVVQNQNAEHFPGRPVRVPVRLDTNPGLTNMRVTVSFDHTRLSIANPNAVTRGTALRNFDFFYGVDTSASEIMAMWLGGTNVDTSIGTLLNINFIVRNNAPPGEAYVRVYVEDADRNDMDIKAQLPVAYGFVVVP